MVNLYEITVFADLKSQILYTHATATHLTISSTVGLNTALLQGEIVGQDMVEQHIHPTALVHLSTQPVVVTEGGDTRRGLAAQARQVLKDNGEEGAQFRLFFCCCKTA